MGFGGTIQVPPFSFIATMDNNELIVSTGQASEAGIKDANEDACGIRVPEGGLLVSKGVAVVIADGVSASEAGKEASNACVQGFLSDYFSTPDSWSVKKSGQKVLGALNHWLHGQGTQLYGTARGMVTTLSVLVIKSTTAHLFHVGDTRIYRLRGKDLECLTQDHRIQVAGDKNYLGRAMGIELRLEIDYRKLEVEKEDVFLLTTDGVHDLSATTKWPPSPLQAKISLMVARKLSLEHSNIKVMTTSPALWCRSTNCPGPTEIKPMST